VFRRKISKTRVQEEALTLNGNFRLPLKFTPSTYKGAFRESFDAHGLAVESEYNAAITGSGRLLPRSGAWRGYVSLKTYG
jgi:hypothetical protein